MYRKNKAPISVLCTSLKMDARGQQVPNESLAVVGNAQSTVVKDFGAFTGSVPVLGSSATAEDGHPNLPHFPSQIPFAWERGKPFISPKFRRLATLPEGCATLRTFHRRTK